MKRLVLVVALAVALLLPVNEKPADAHIDWSTPFSICQLINVAYFENPTGVNYNVFRASDFNFFGHFGVSCTIYRAAYTGSPPGPYGWICYVYDRHTHEIFWIACPGP